MPLITNKEIIISPGSVPDDYEEFGLFYTTDTTKLLGIEKSMKDIIDNITKEAKQEGVRAIFNFRIETSCREGSIFCIAYGTAARPKG